MGLALTFLRGNWQHLLIGALLLFGIWKIDQNGFNRAKNQAEAAERARVEMERRINQKIERAIADGVAAIDQRTGAQLATIDRDERTIVQPTLIREIARDPRYSDPAAGISDGMLRALNSARGAAPGDPAAQRRNQRPLP